MNVRKLTMRHLSQSWRMLLLTMFCYLFFYTGRHNFGWASKALAEYLSVSYEKIGWISFSMLIGYAVGQFVNGNLADRFSPKKMVALGGILSVAANVAISFSSSYTVILVLWLMNGYFQSLAWAPGGRIITNWWPDRKRGMAFGLYTMSAASSSILTYLFSIMLINQPWQNLFRIPLMFLLVAIIIFYIFVQDKPTSSITEEQTDKLNEKPHWKDGYRAAFCNEAFLITCFSIGFQSMTRYALIFWLPLYFLGDNYKSTPDQVWVSILLPVGMAFGALSFGIISDRLFRGKRVYSISMGMFICFIVSLTIYLLPIQSHVVMGILIFLSGFFAFGPQANFWPLSPELLGAKYVGTGIGIMNMFAYLFAALGEPLTGKLIDIFESESVIFLAVSITALLSSLSILLVYMKGWRKRRVSGY